MNRALEQKSKRMTKWICQGMNLYQRLRIEWKIYVEARQWNRSFVLHLKQRWKAYKERPALHAALDAWANTTTPVSRRMNESDDAFRERLLKDKRDL